MYQTFSYPYPRFAPLWGAVLFVCLIHGLALAKDPPEKTRDAKVAPSLPEAAFAILKNYDAHALPRITPTIKDIDALGDIEDNDRKRKPAAAERQRQAPQLAATCLYKALKSLIAVRQSTEENGFDWSSAKLVGASVGSEPYDAKSKVRQVDIVLTIDSKDKSIDITLDDCFLLNGRRLMADGFRMR